jgi:hypothetical protein
VRSSLKNTLLKKVWMTSPLSHERMAGRLEKAIWYGRFIRWCRAHECRVSNWRPAIYEDLFASTLKDEAITYLEFGTFEGRSMRWWLDLSRNPASRFYGFDTFEGLPAAWEGYERSHFSTGKLPDMRDDRCRFIQGLFQDTLPNFLKLYHLGGGGRLYMLTPTCFLQPFMS